MAVWEHVSMISTVLYGTMAGILFIYSMCLNDVTFFPYITLHSRMLLQ